MKKIDLNSDLGESFGRYILGNDAAILEAVSSANIACGFHAGDPVVMSETVQTAIEKGVSIGAHPGYPDLTGFGRRAMALSPKELDAYVTYQLGALQAFVGRYGGRMNHVKPHGALYNLAARDYETARILAEAIYKFDPTLFFVGLAGSEMIRAGNKVGLKTASEVFADRAYTKEGLLVDRAQPGSVIQGTQEQIKRVVQMIKEGRVLSVEGDWIEIQADTVCIHGDGENAAPFSKQLKAALEAEQIEVASLS